MSSTLKMTSHYKQKRADLKNNHRPRWKELQHHHLIRFPTPHRNHTSTRPHKIRIPIFGFSKGGSNICKLILEIEPDFDTVLIGDSNLRLMRHCKIPSNWQVFGISGLKMEHMAGLFSKIVGPKPKTIILALGVNNRESFFPTITAPLIDGMVRALNKSFPLSRKVVVGISARDLSTRTMNNIQSINDKLESILGKNYIKPLRTADIIILKDQFKIHHDQVTVDRVLNSITSSLN